MLRKKKTASQIKKPIVYAFIDSQNLNLSLRNDIYRGPTKIYTGWSLDFARFRIYLSAKYSVSKAYLFIGYRKEYEKLYKYLKESGFELIFKPTLEADGKTKGNVDAELVLHSVDMLQQYDKAVLITGDGDFHCLVEYLIKKGKLGKVLIPNQISYSSLLRKFKEYLSFITSLQEKLEIKKDRHLRGI